MIDNRSDAESTARVSAEGAPATGAGGAIPATESDGTSFLTFAIGAQVFALDVRTVRRILDPQPVAPLPGGASGFVGLIDHAGESIPLAATDRVLGVHAEALRNAQHAGAALSQAGSHTEGTSTDTPRAASPSSDSRAGECRLLIVEAGTSRQPICFAADRVVDVVHANVATFEALPGRIADAGPLVGVMRLAGAFVMVIAADRLLAALEAAPEPPRRASPPSEGSASRTDPARPRAPSLAPESSAPDPSMTPPT